MRRLSADDSVGVVPRSRSQSNRGGAVGVIGAGVRKSARSASAASALATRDMLKGTTACTADEQRRERDVKANAKGGGAGRVVTKRADVPRTPPAKKRAKATSAGRAELRLAEPAGVDGTEDVAAASAVAKAAADVDALLLQAAAAEAEATAPGVSAEEQRRIIAAAEALASSEAGVPAKSSRVIASLLNKWVDFVEMHGDEYGYDAAAGPTVELAKHFSSWGFFNRESFSTVGLDGMGDSWGELAVPYLLPKFVFPLMKYEAWCGLTPDALETKCRPYLSELKENWKRLKVRSMLLRVELHPRVCCERE